MDCRISIVKLAYRKEKYNNSAGLLRFVAVYVVTAKGGAQMARISIEALHTGEGAGGKYGNGGIMGAVATELFTHGVSDGYHAKTWADLLLIKHSLLAAEQMIQEGDSISGMTDSEPSSFHAKG